MKTVTQAEQQKTAFPLQEENDVSIKRLLADVVVYSPVESSSTISSNSVRWKKRAAVKYKVMREMKTPMTVEEMASL